MHNMGLDMYLYQKEVSEVAYWRKANAIHGWFMQHATVDDCSPVTISKDQLTELRDTCAKVLDINTDDAAEEFLPPTNGFFFGSSKIDEWYWKDLKETVSTLDHILEHSIEDAMFEYQASW